MRKFVKTKWSLLLLVLFGILLFGGSTNTYAATVAKIGSKSYSSLQKAVNEVKPNQTIKLQKNITLTKPIYCRKNVKYTIDLQKHVINMKLNKKTYNSGQINIEKGNILLKNGSVKKIKSSEEFSIIDISKMAKTTFSNLKINGHVSNDGILTINSGTYRSSDDKEGLINNDGTTIIKKGTFTGTIGNSHKCTIYAGTFKSTNSNILLSCYGEYAISNIKGGTFIGNISSNGKINLSRGNLTGLITIKGDGVLNMTGGTIKNMRTDKRPPISITASGILNMNGGTIKAVGSKEGSVAVSIPRQGKAYLQKGTISGGFSEGNYKSGYCVIRSTGTVKKSKSFKIINNGNASDIWYDYYDYDYDDEDEYFDDEDVYYDDEDVYYDDVESLD